MPEEVLNTGQEPVGYINLSLKDYITNFKPKLSGEYTIDHYEQNGPVVLLTMFFKPDEDKQFDMPNEQWRIKFVPNLWSWIESLRKGLDKDFGTIQSISLKGFYPYNDTIKFGVEIFTTTKKVTDWYNRPLSVTEKDREKLKENLEKWAEKKLKEWNGNVIKEALDTLDPVIKIDSVEKGSKPDTTDVLWYTEQMDQSKILTIPNEKIVDYIKDNTTDWEDYMVSADDEDDPTAEFFDFGDWKLHNQTYYVDEIIAEYAIKIIKHNKLVK